VGGIRSKDDGKMKEEEKKKRERERERERESEFAYAYECYMEMSYSTFSQGLENSGQI
jgi:hypothetical protein